MGRLQGDGAARCTTRFFQLRLWDSEALLDEILAVYDKLSSDIQAELPLKKVWQLVQDVADET